MPKCYSDGLLERGEKKARMTERERRGEREGEGGGGRACPSLSDWLSSAGERTTGVGRQNMDRWTVGLGWQAA